MASAGAIAAASHLRGIRFPWESAADGSDVTPPYLGREGHLVPVLTDDHEEHVVADVAWAADRLVQWTGDPHLAAGPVRTILLETARYWASRLEHESDPRHLTAVMGPDEYHDLVDDDVFTNAMARWNLRRGADLVDDAQEAERWLELADGLVEGWDDERGAHEQFAGYWALEPLLAAQVAEVPFAADLLLGADRVARSQLVKQPDVLMAHHLVPDELRAGSLDADLDVYGPRTVHGSSLSPAIHSTLLAQAGRPDEALSMFRLAARLDLDDITGTTADGLHLATMGGLWQALAHGFLGIRVGGGLLAVDPHLPQAWRSVAISFHHHGRLVRIRADDEHVELTCAEPMEVVVAERRVEHHAGHTTFPVHRPPEDRP
jgi:trehalose/maltose hydrolase-like predicted phosphorylase